MGKVTSIDRQREGDVSSAQRFVRVTNPDHKGFVEFQFSIGDPSLYLEMTLPPPAFAEFCRQHAAIHLGDEAAREVDAREARWHSGQPLED